MRPVLAPIALAALAAAAPASAHLQHPNVAGDSRARVLVQFARSSSRAAEDTILVRAGVRRVETLPQLDTVVGSVPPDRRRHALTLLSETRGVVSATPDGRARLLDAAPAAIALTTTSSSSWQLLRADLPQAWQVTKGRPSVVVAVVDSGVETDHPALQGRVLAGRDLVNGDDDASDDNGHGTAVAGIIAAPALPDGSAGACSDCRVLPVKVLAADGTGDWGTIAAGIVWAVDHGAQVINLSIGSPRAPVVVAAAVSYAISKGVIVVAAAGNDGANETFYPAAYPGVISVAGINETDGRYPWSNFGNWVTVAAPGCMTTTWLNKEYLPDFCGTSTAAPFVAGLAGLALAFKPALGPAAFGTALTASTSALPDPTTAGFGRVNANQLLITLGAPATPPTMGAPPSLTTTPAVSRPVAATAGTWSGATSLSYRWQRSRDGVTWRDVGSSTTYTPRTTDLGYRLRVVVAATNPRGSTTSLSQPSAPISATAPSRRKPAEKATLAAPTRTKTAPR